MWYNCCFKTSDRRHRWLFCFILSSRQRAYYMRYRLYIYLTKFLHFLPTANKPAGSILKSTINALTHFQSNREIMFFCLFVLLYNFTENMSFNIKWLCYFDHLQFVRWSIAEKYYKIAEVVTW